jgi:hypothetical protein
MWAAAGARRPIQGVVEREQARFRVEAILAARKSIERSLLTRGGRFENCSATGKKLTASTGGVIIIATLNRRAVQPIVDRDQAAIGDRVPTRGV